MENAINDIDGGPFYSMGITFERYEHNIEPVFPCLFVPIMFPSDKYNWAEAEIVPCKIRSAGHYFKIKNFQI